MWLARMALHRYKDNSVIIAASSYKFFKTTIYPCNVNRNCQSAFSNINFLLQKQPFEYSSREICSFYNSVLGSLQSLDFKDLFSVF